MLELGLTLKKRSNLMWHLDNIYRGKEKTDLSRCQSGF